MQIIRSFEELLSQPRQSVVTVGNFDGLHLAHRELIQCVRADAAKRGCTSAVLTFEPHPFRILRPQNAPPLITPVPDKIGYFAETGIDLLVLLPFTRDLSLLSPLEFAERVLVEGLGTVSIHEGANFHFGHQQAGNIAALQRFGREFHFDVHVHPEMRIGRDIVSSSRIRELVRAGNVARARRLLGRCFCVRGPIGQGRGIGRRLTVPTLNLQHYEELLPGKGVYTTQTAVGHRWFQSVTNVGTRPTFVASTSETLTVESHLLDFEQVDIEDMQVCFLHRVRDERKFESPAALKEQILRDIQQARRYFRLAGALKSPSARPQP